MPQLDYPNQQVLCVPRTLKNRACRYSENDNGEACTTYMAWAYDEVQIRDYAEWFDWSSPTYIECVVESLASPLTNGNIAAVNVSIVAEATLVDVAGLEADLDGAKRNFDCSELSHCILKDM